MAYEDPRHDTLTSTLAKIVDDIRELFREEVALARAEVRQEIGGFSAAAIRFGVGAFAGVFAVGFLLLAVAQAFARLVAWPVWGGYLAMAILLGICALIALQAARSRARKVPAVPRETVATLKETKEWLQHRMTSERR
jgi:hypothetical protein